VPESADAKRAVVLASASVQRKQLLLQIGIDAQCVPADIDESLLVDETAKTYVKRLAGEKCRVIAQRYPDAIVIAADTTISIKDRVLAKAANLQEAQEILSLLSGAQHTVYTGLAVFSAGAQHELVCQTTVKFRDIAPCEIVAYWNGGEPQGKAGCYAIQGRGAIFVDSIQGSYSNVVGLPLRETAALLAHFDNPLL